MNRFWRGDSTGVKWEVFSLISNLSRAALVATMAVPKFYYPLLLVLLAPTIYVITDSALELLCVLGYKEPLENMALVPEAGLLSLPMLLNLNSPAAFRETEAGGRGAVVSIALQIGNSGPKMEHKNVMIEVVAFISINVLCRCY